MSRHADGKEQLEPLQERSTVVRTKVLTVRIDGTINTFSKMGNDAALWRPSKGTHAYIFGSDAQFNDRSIDNRSAIDTDAMNAAISNVTVKELSVEQSVSTFKIPVGVSINCIPGMEHTSTGECYAFTTFPETSTSIPQMIYQTSDDCSKADIWRRKFPEYNADNLETQGVLEMKNCPYVFVHQNHPVISLITMNPEMVGTDINTCARVDSEWYKITHEVHSSSCRAIKDRILSTVSTQNLANFQVQLHKLGGGDWSDIDATDLLSSFKTNPEWTKEETEKQLKLHEVEAKNKPECFMARIKIVYQMRPPGNLQ
jgi:hypothetical protein